MSRLLAVATALPPHVIDQSQAKAFAREHFAGSHADIDRLLDLFDHAEIEKRSICVPVDWFRTARRFSEKNDTYLHWAQRLSEEAARSCLEQAGVPPDGVDYIIVVSTTGLATPSLDARLMGRLGMRPDARRTPIWGLGCAGGVAGLAHAHHYTLGHPEARILVVAVELCSITFQFGDRSKSNLVATALFADGAAAVLVAGDAAACGGTEIVDTRSTIWPDSLEVMGWNFETEGMQVVFSRAIPAIVLREARSNTEEFLSLHGLSIGDIEHLVAHPGGARVMDAYEQALALGDDRMAPAREVLRRCGNMSSATVFFVLREVLDRAPRRDAWGLALALGPGFSSEQVLLRF